MRTPEGKVKDAVKKFLHSRKVQSLTHPIEGAVGFYWMPVPSGMGSSFLDFVIVYRGFFIAFETKSPGGKPTARQRLIMEMLEQAGAWGAWGCDVERLEHIFNELDRDD